MRITRYAATLAAFGLLLTGCSSEAGNEAADTSAEKTAAVETADPESFFTTPRSDRAKDFLSKILGH